MIWRPSVRVQRPSNVVRGLVRDLKKSHASHGVVGISEKLQLDLYVRQRCGPEKHGGPSREREDSQNQDDSTEWVDVRFHRGRGVMGETAASHLPSKEV